jgi:ankyrin repeat protein
MTSFEDYELSHVTKVVLGFRPLDIGAELERPENRALVNRVDKTGLTPLHWAATIGNSGAVQKLIEAGADPNAKDPWANTSLTRASQRSSSALCLEHSFWQVHRLTALTVAPHSKLSTKLWLRVIPKTCCRSCLLEEQT